MPFSMSVKSFVWRTIDKLFALVVPLQRRLRRLFRCIQVEFGCSLFEPPAVVAGLIDDVHLFENCELAIA